MPLEPGIPEYLVEPAEYGVEVDEETCEIQLIDFGEGKVLLQLIILPSQSPG